METKRFTTELEEAAAVLRQGGLVAVPTETVYGLAGNGLNEEAVRSIYEVKGRPEVKPLSLMVPGAEAMALYCRDVPAGAYALAEAFWPGPLTIVLPVRENVVPALPRAGGATVGLRCPDHPLTLALLRACALPLAAPSANPSGAPSPRTAEEVLSYFDGRIEGVLDGGECEIGTESTILDMSRTPYRILRQGALSAERVQKALVDSLTLIGITGGTGSGKTTALQVLEEMGARIIDCDEVYHTLTVESEAMRRELCERFGEVYNGSVLDRAKLGKIVFKDASALADLNAITHKYVDGKIDELLLEHAMNGGRVAAIDAIALLENRFATRTVCNVAVTAPVEDRVRRLMAREGVSEEYARMRIAAQKSDDYFAEHCDHVLCNDGDMASFQSKCRNYFSEVLKDVR